jgi:hypothetical protein
VVAAVAGTLAVLAAEGVGHRIQPDNPFRLRDQWLIGDFGLVTYCGGTADQVSRRAECRRAGDA